MLDQKYFYGGELGETQTLSVGAAASSQKLTPGRYLVYPLDLTGGTERCWIRQRAEGVADATAAPPSTVMGTGAARSFELVVRHAPINSGLRPKEYLSVIGEAGVTGTLHIVRISRSKL